jgi:FKBP-type peptidyl-prolyl cis-trans isomerase
MKRLAAALLLCTLTSCRSDQTEPDPRPQPTPVQTTTADGLVIEDLRLGTGDPCPPSATVTMNFTASFADGRVFDSSEMRKRPLTFSLSKPGAIRGLREGIPGMRLGGKRRLRIPWQLAYGEQGRDPVPPKTDLIFEIELIGFDPKAK